MEPDDHSDHEHQVFAGSIEDFKEFFKEQKDLGKMAEQDTANWIRRMVFEELTQDQRGLLTQIFVAIATDHNPIGKAQFYAGYVMGARDLLDHQAPVAIPEV